MRTILKIEKKGKKPKKGEEKKKLNAYILFVHDLLTNVFYETRITHKEATRLSEFKIYRVGTQEIRKLKESSYQLAGTLTDKKYSYFEISKHRNKLIKTEQKKLPFHYKENELQFV